MSKKAKIASVIVLAILTPVTNDASGESSGYVILCGRDVHPPWTFTGQGSDTLRLNGFPYLPSRCGEKRSEPSVSDAVRAEVALRKAASDAANQASTSDEKLEMMSEVYRNSTLVDSTFVRDWGLEIYWHGETGPDTRFVSKHNTQSQTRSEIHQDYVDSFWSMMDIGALLLVLSDRRVVIPGQYLTDTLALIDSLRAGISIPDSVIALSPLRMIPRQKLEYEFQGRK